MRGNRLFAVLLAGLLQLAPVWRTFIPLEARALAPSSWAWVLQLGAGAVALLGGYDSVSGATQIVAPYTVNATTGVAYSRQLTTSGQTAHSWSASTAAIGTPVFPLTPGLWLTNANGKIGGVPTWAGTSNITIKAWQNSGNSGASVSSVFVFTITNGTSSATLPAITGQPRNQTNYPNSTVTFTVTATGSAPLSYQWRFQGAAIANATATACTIAGVQSANAGNYSVVVTNAAGSVTSANATLTVLPTTADLIATVFGPTTVSPGMSLDCVVSVTNLGPNVASNVIVSDTLPSNAVFVGTTGGGTLGSAMVTWPPIGSLAAGATTNFTVTLTAPNDGSLTNTASATSNATDPNSSNNNGTAPSSRLITSIAPQADVIVACSGPASINAGANLSYLIQVTNLGPSVASNVIVSDALPSGAVLVSASGGSSATAGGVTWPPILSLARGQWTTFSLTIRAPATGTLTNLASGSSPTPDPIASNNDGTSAPARVITAVQPVADLVVLASGPAAALEGVNIGYSITVSNLGPSTASNVIVTDTLPAGTPFVNASGGGVINGGVVTWPVIGSIDSGGFITFSLTVTAPASGILTNRASCSSLTPDPVAANNDGTATASTVTTEIGLLADVAVLMTGPAIVLPGSNLTYTITVSNLGPTVATNVIVQNPLPSGLTFVNASGGVAPSGGMLIWPAIDSLAPGAFTSFDVTVAGPTSGTVTNSASANSGTPDPNQANNNGTATASRWELSITPQADLAVEASGPATVPAGSTFTYAILVTNLGPSTAANIVVQDALPATVTFVSATGGGVVSGGIVTWPAISTLDAATSANFSVTVRAPAAGTLTNRASGTSPTYDPAPGNHDGSGAAARVITTVQPRADLVVGVSGPTAALPGGTVTYNIGVTNLGPSTASNVVASDRFPVNANLVSAPGASVSNNLVTWPLIASLASGASSNYTLTITAPATGVLTNTGFAISETVDPNPSNNDGTLPSSGTITAIVTDQFGIVADAIVLNPQSGLFEQVARVTNTGPGTIAAFRLFVVGLRTGVQLYNATGTNAGKPYVQYNAALNPGQTATLHLEFFVPDRQPFTDTFSAEVALPSSSATVSGGGISISRAFVDSHTGAAPRFVIEFPSNPGRVYTIIYCDSLSNSWKVATPSVTATATITQWYDDGPPKTDSPPLGAGGTRLYRVLLNP